MQRTQVHCSVSANETRAPIGRCFVLAETEGFGHSRGYCVRPNGLQNSSLLESYRFCPLIGLFISLTFMKMLNESCACLPDTLPPLAAVLPSTSFMPPA